MRRSSSHKSEFHVNNNSVSEHRPNAQETGGTLIAVMLPWVNVSSYSYSFEEIV